MTLATDGASSATLSGRELALKRRQAMALHGKSGVMKTASVMSPKPVAARSIAPVASVVTEAPTPASNQVITPVAVSASRARREALSTHGKAAIQSQAPRPAARVRPQPVEVVAPSVAAYPVAASMLVVPVAAPSASRARREALSTKGKAALQTPATRPTGRVREAVSMTALAAASSCGCMAENSVAGMAADVMQVTCLPSDAERGACKPIEAPTGRALARARRAALAQDGKSGLKRVALATKIATTMPGQDWQAALTKGATGRQVSMQHRVAQSLAGAMGSSQSSRPVGRVRPALVKVEQGHTLSGTEVSGTMVERSKKVTGNEPGSCRAVTGTEYVGAEQFDSLCSTRPEPAPSKVAVSSTAREQQVTGTEVGRSKNVTGDEPGACRSITGTEYLAVERYNEFCSTRPVPAPAKVMQGHTVKGMAVTGVQNELSKKVTGDEFRAGSVLTGTGAGTTASDNEARAPQKVSVTHTSHGKPVSGTVVGHAAQITGDEVGACLGITGTEYLAREQFEGVCSTAQPQTPRKVSVMSTRANLPVSGSEVGRSSKVTGDEPGSCRAISGSQYFSSGGFGALCDAASPRKVASMQTSAGRTFTGTALGSSPKLSGDEKGGCMPVTGTEYVGAGQQQAVCAVSTPIAPVAKVAVDQTWRGQSVTGTYVGRSEQVTGDEPGGCSPISGTPYIGRNQYKGFCQTPAILAQEAKIRMSTLVSALDVTGDRPGAGGSKMTGDERGACGLISGTPYVGVDNSAQHCPSSSRFVSRANTWVETARAPAPQDFSVVAPARAAQQKQFDRQFDNVSGSMFGSSDRITGSNSKASGLITGTPEFRHRDAVSSAPVAPAIVMPAAHRLTGEGSQTGRGITGDTWNGLSRMTGTEGASSLSRNLTERGSPRGAGMNAIRFREELESPKEQAPEALVSRVTGSSGGVGKVSRVTLSGGARG